jgi:hypothetical protein
MDGEWGGHRPAEEMSQADQVVIKAMAAFAFLAAAYVTQPQNWPAFTAWVSSEGTPIEGTLEHAQFLTGLLQDAAGLGVSGG